ncbi:hypothetical protein [Nocardia sp. NPDC051463]|uniref:hypothetical protein n=1 Tax=Nocardia sp. NPDC051463 TaxID=3154845 RepID=UPI00344D7284
MANNQMRLTRGSRTEAAGDDLGIGSADADLQDLNEHAAFTRWRRTDVDKPWGSVLFGVDNNGEIRRFRLRCWMYKPRSHHYRPLFTALLATATA